MSVFKHILLKIGSFSAVFLSAIPFANAADSVGNWTDFTNAVQNGADITITEDLTAPKITKSITTDTETIDLGKHTVTFTDSSTPSVFKISANNRTIFKNGTFSDYSTGSIIEIIANSSAVIENMTFNNINAKTGVAIKNYGDTLIQGTNVFSNNTISEKNPSGSIRNYENSNLVITGKITFDHNTATDGRGAGIANEGTLYLGTQASPITAIFTSNTAGYGTAIFAQPSTTTHIIGNITFGEYDTTTKKTSKGNTTTVTAAIHNSADATLNIEGTGGFYGNSSRDGGVLQNNGFATLNGTYDFISNSASTNGGAIYNLENRKLDLIGTYNFDNNSATTWGGAIYNIGTANLSGSFTFNGNNASTGGAIYNSGSMSIYGSGTFSNNNATTNGSTIYNIGRLVITGENGPFIFSNSNGNSLYNMGTAEKYAEAHINNAEFHNNTPNGTSGNFNGTYRGSPYSITNLNNVKFYDNTNGKNGNGYGGAAISSSNDHTRINIANSEFRNNKGQESAVNNGYRINIINSKFQNNVNNNTITTRNGAITFNGEILKLIADRGNVLFEGNTSKSGNIGFSAYTSTDATTPTQQIYFNAGNGGEIKFNDMITGGKYQSSAKNVGTIQINNHIQMANSTTNEETSVDYFSYENLLENGIDAVEDKTAPTDGRVVFNNAIKNIDLALYNGTLAFGETRTDKNGNLIKAEGRKYIEKGTKTSEGEYGSLYLYGGTLDLQNGVIEGEHAKATDDEFGFKKVYVDTTKKDANGDYLYGNSEGYVNIELDMDLTNKTIDYINSDIVDAAPTTTTSGDTSSGDTSSTDTTSTDTPKSKIKISSIGLMGDFGENYNLGEAENFKFAKSNKVDTELSAITEVIISNNAGYKFGIADDKTNGKNSIAVTKIIDAGGLPVALSSGSTYGVSSEFSEEGENITDWYKTYNMYIPGETSTSKGQIVKAFGTNYQKGAEFKLNGNNKTLTASSQPSGKKMTGIIVGLKTEDVLADKLDENGNQLFDDDGNPIKVKTGDKVTGTMTQNFIAENISKWSGFDTALTINEGSTANLKNIIFGENNLDILNDGHLYMSGINTIASGIDTSTPDNEASGIIGTGTLDITGGNTTSNATITQGKLTIGELATLTIDADNLHNTVAHNFGTINFSDGHIDKDVTGIITTSTTDTDTNETTETSSLAGTTNIVSGDVFVNKNVTVSQHDVNIKENASLQNNGNIFADEITNEGTLTSNADTITATIDNQNELILTGGSAENHLIQNNVITDSEAIYNGVLRIASGAFIENNKKIEQKTLFNEGWFKTSLSLLDLSDKIDNAGTLSLSGVLAGTAAQNNKIVNGAGTLILENNITSSAAITQNMVEIALNAKVINTDSGTIDAKTSIINNGNFTTNAQNIATQNLYNNKNLTLTNGEITYNIIGNHTDDGDKNSKTFITGNVELDNNANGEENHFAIIDDVQINKNALLAISVGTIEGVIDIVGKTNSDPDTVTSGILRITGNGTLSADTIQGSGELQIVGTIVNDNSYIKNNITIYAGHSLETKLAYLTGAHSLTNKGSLLLFGNNTLTRTINGAGTTKLINRNDTPASLTMKNNAQIEGTLDLNNGNLLLSNIENNDTGSYTVNNLKGTGNLSINVDMESKPLKSDILHVSNAQEGTTLNLTGINVIKNADITNTEKTGTLTYVVGDATNNINYTLNGNTSNVYTTASLGVLYKFSLADKGKLNVVYSSFDSTLQNYILGKLVDYNIDSYSVDNSFALTHDGDFLVTAGKTTKTVNLNGFTLNGDNKTLNGIRVNDNYTLNLQADKISDLKDFNTALAINNNANASIHNITFTNNNTDILNNGNLSFSGTNNASAIVNNKNFTVTAGDSTINALSHNTDDEDNTAPNSSLTVNENASLTLHQITQTNVTNNGTLAIDVNNSTVTNGITNNKNLTLNGDNTAKVNNLNVSGANGSTTFTNKVTNNASIAQKKITIASSANLVNNENGYLSASDNVTNNGTLTTSADTSAINANIVNNNALHFTSGNFEKNLSGTNGTLYIDGATSFANTASVQQKIINNNSSSTNNTTITATTFNNNENASLTNNGAIKATSLNNNTSALITNNNIITTANLNNKATISQEDNASLNITNTATNDTNASISGGTVNVSGSMTNNGSILNGLLNVGSSSTSNAILNNENSIASETTVFTSNTLNNNNSAQISGNITNNGTLNNNNTASISGTLTNNGIVNNKDNALLNDIINNQNATLNSRADGFNQDIVNAGTVNLSTGTLNHNINNITNTDETVSTGNTYILADAEVTIDTNVNVKNNLTNNATLINNGTISGNTQNNSTLTNNSSLANVTNSATLYNTSSATISGTLTNTGTIHNTGNIYDVTNLGSGVINSNASLFKGSIANNATINLSGGKLSQNITQKGIVNLDNASTSLTLDNNISIDGTLNLNGGQLVASSATINNLNLDNGSLSSVDDAINNIIINKITGTGNLALDVNMLNETADTLDIEQADNASLNINHINIATDLTPTAKSGSASILYVKGNAANDISYSLTPSPYTTSSSTYTTATNNLIYTFTLGDKGYLNVNWVDNDFTLENYLNGTLSAIDNFSFTENDTLNNAVTTSGSDKNKLVYLNGYTLSANNNSGISVDNGYQLDLIGSKNASNSSNSTISGFNTALINNGTLNITNLAFENNSTDVINYNTLNLFARTIFNSIQNLHNLVISGIASITSLTGDTGHTTINADASLTINGSLTQHSLTNNGTISGGTINILNSATNNTNASISGSTVNVLGSTTNNGSILNGTLNVGSSSTSNAILNNENSIASETTVFTSNTLNNNNSAQISGNITNNGTLNNNNTASISGTLTNNGIVNNKDDALLNDVINNQNATLNSRADGFNQDIANAGTVNLSTGTLNHNINNITNTDETVSTGNTYILADAEVTIDNNVNVENNLTNNATLINNGTISGNTQNNDTLNNNSSLANVTNDGTLNNNANGTITGTLTNNATLTNNGTISGNTQNNDTLTNNNSLANVTNDGTLNNNANGTITGTLTNNATLTNNGTISGDTQNNDTLNNNNSLANVTNDGTLNNNANGTITGTLTNNNTLTNNGTISGNTQNYGTLNNSGSLASITNNAGATLTSAASGLNDTVINNGSFNLAGGNLNQNINGSGTTFITNDTSVNDNVNINNNLNINADKKLTSLLANISGNIINNGTLILKETFVNLAQKIAGLGTTAFEQDNITLTFNNNAEIDGTLKLNNDIIDLRLSSDGTSADYNTYSIGSLEAENAQLKIDVDMASRTNDKLFISDGSHNNGSLNLNAINILKDNADGLGGSDIFTYLDGNLNNLTLSVGSADSNQISTVTNRYQYIFSSHNDGKLDVSMTLLNAPLTLKEFIEGTLPINADTFSFTDDIILTEEQTPLLATSHNNEFNTLNIFFNNHTLSGFSDNNNNLFNGINVDNNMTLILDNGTISGFDNALTIAQNSSAVLNNMTLFNNNSDIINNGSLALTNANINSIENNNQMTINGTTSIDDISGTSGNLTINNNGVLNLNNALTQDTLLNNGTLNNNGMINTKLSNNDTIYNNANASIAGEITNNGDIHNNGDILADIANNANIYNTGTIAHILNKTNANLTSSASGLTENITNDGNIYLTGGSLAHNITGSGFTFINNDTTFNTNTEVQNKLVNDASLMNYASITGEIINNKTITNNGSISGNTQNFGILTNNGSLADVTNNGSLYNNANASINGTITNNNNLTNDGKISGNIANSGTINNYGSISNTLLNEGDIINSGSINAKLSNSGNISGQAITALENSYNSGNILAQLIIGNGTDNATFVNNGMLNDVLINQNASLDTSLLNVNDITNNGLLTLSDDNATLNNNISGTGTTNILGNIALGNGSLSLNGTTHVLDNASLDIASQTLALDTLKLDGTLKINIDDVEPNSSKYSGGKLEVNHLVLGNNSKFNLTLDTDAGKQLKGGQSTDDLLIISSDDINGDFAHIFEDNLRYKVSQGKSKGSYIITNTASAEDVVAPFGNVNNINTAAAYDALSSSNPTVKAIQDILNNLSQHDLDAYRNTLTSIAPVDSQIVYANIIEINNNVNRQIERNTFAADGVSAGDFFNKARAWINILSVNSTQTGNQKHAGFDADTSSAIFGIDGYYNDATKIGIGYAHHKTDASSHARDLNINGHTFFIYGKYQPKKYYVRGIMNYNLANYKDDARIAGLNIRSDYNTYGFGIESYIGYDDCKNCRTITPEIGFRYNHIKKDNYADSIGQRIHTNDTDILTAAASIKVENEFTYDDAYFKPSFFIGSTYDVKSADTDAIVRVGDTAYAISAQKLSPFAFNAGVDIKYERNSWELSLGYDLDIRRNYSAHSTSLKLKYNF